MPLLAGKIDGQCRTTKVTTEQVEPALEMDREEDPLTPVAPLSNMMGKPWNNNARNSSHKMRLK